MHGFNGLTEDSLDDPEVREEAFSVGRENGASWRRRDERYIQTPLRGMFGPTTGDRVRLADTELIVRVEEDLTLAGEEATFGGGKFRLCAVRILARDATALYRALNTFRAVARACLDLPPAERGEVA